MAAHAKRIVELTDGRISADRRNAPVAGDPPGLIDLTELESTEVSVEETDVGGQGWPV